MSESEAFEIWYEAYLNNYDGTGFMDVKTLAEQAWKAALNFAETERLLSGK